MNEIHEKVNNYVMRDIGNLETIIFAIKQSLQYATTEEETSIYLEAIGRYENDLKELQLCVMQ